MSVAVSGSWNPLVDLDQHFKKYTLEKKILEYIVCSKGKDTFVKPLFPVVCVLRFVT